MHILRLRLKNSPGEREARKGGFRARPLPLYGGRGFVFCGLRCKNNGYRFAVDAAREAERAAPLDPRTRTALAILLCRNARVFFYKLFFLSDSIRDFIRRIQWSDLRVATGRVTRHIL